VDVGRFERWELDELGVVFFEEDEEEVFLEDELFLEEELSATSGVSVAAASPNNPSRRRIWERCMGSPAK
jgi:hypothetical protein